MTVEAKPKNSKLTWILVGIILVLAVGLIGVLLLLEKPAATQTRHGPDPANCTQRSKLS